MAKRRSVKRKYNAALHPRGAKGRFVKKGGAKARKPTARKPTKAAPKKATHNYYRTAARIAVAGGAAAAFWYKRPTNLFAVPLVLAAKGFNKPPRSYYTNLHR